MTKTKAKSSRYDFVIKAKGTYTRILEISQTAVRVEGSEKGTVSGKYYSGFHWDTVEATIVSDGSATLTIRYMQVTNKGESVVGTGTGTQSPSNSKGIAKVTGEGTMWTSAPRLQKLNGARWRVEGEYNMIKESLEIRGNFELSN